MVAGTLLTASLGLFANIRLERLRADLKEEVDARLEERKAELKREADIAIEQLRAELKYRSDLLSDAEKQARNVRAGIYADFCKAFAGNAMARRHQDKAKIQETTTLYLDAKARVAVYGGAGVIAALAAFERGGAALDAPDQEARYIALCREMRTDSGVGTGPKQDADIAVALFGARQGALS